jgi:hypothetical protein
VVNVRRANLVLWSATALLAAAAAGSVLLAVALPVEVNEQAARPAADRRAGPVAATRPAPAMDELRQAWEAPLRQQLVETAAKPPAAGDGAIATPSQAPVPITLVGTIGQTLALVKINNTSVVEVRGVGEKIAGAEILAVRPAQVDVKFNGRMVTLKKAPDPAAKKPGT